MTTEDDKRTRLETEAREGWFESHPGAREDGASIFPRTVDGREMFFKTLGRATDVIDEQEFRARLWLSQQKP